jgi:hypothetical protein
MTAGVQWDGASVNQKVGTIAQQTWDALQAARACYLWLNDHGGKATLTGLGINSTDADTIMNAIGALGGPSGLWSVAHNKMTPSGGSDYFFDAKNLTGTQYSGSAFS